MSYPATFSVADPDGNVQNDGSSMVVFTNPKKGSYKLNLQPKKLGVDIIVVQFLTDGRTI